MTNFEKLQSLNKSELADFLCELFPDCTRNCPGYDLCKNGVRGTAIWLNQKVEEDE